MKNLSILLLFGLLCASVAADEDSNEFESDEIIIDVGPAEPIVSQYSSLSNVVQQNQRKAQPIEIITPFGYQGIFDQPQQYLSSGSLQGLRQYFPALFTALGQTNGRPQSIQQSQFSQPAVISQVQSTLNPDGTFFLNRNIVPVSGVSSIGGGQTASQTGVVGVNQPVPANLQFNFRANENRQGIQSVSGYLPTQQLTFGSVPSFVPKQFVPVKASFSQIGINTNQPQGNQFSSGQPIAAIRQNTIVPTIESNSLASPIAQQSSFTVGGQTFQIPVTQQQVPASGSKPLGFFFSTVRQPTDQGSIVAQNSVFGQETFSTRPQLPNQQPTIVQQAFRQPFATAHQIPLEQSQLLGEPTFGQSSPVRQQSVRQTSAAGQQATFGQPLVAGQQAFGQPSLVGQQAFGQTSVAGQQASFGQLSVTGQQAVGQSSPVRQQIFGQASVAGQQTTFGQPSTTGQQAFGQSSSVGQQAFGQTSGAGQQATFGQPSTAGQQAFGQSSSVGQQTFGQASVAGQQTTFGQPSTTGQQGFGQFSSVGHQAFGQTSVAGQQATFGQPSTAGQQAFGQSSSVGQQAFGQTSGAGQQNTAPQPILVNQPAFGALRSDSATLEDQSSFGVNESPNFGSSAAFKTDVAKVSENLDYDVSVGNAKFNSGFDFDESESFDTKVYDHV